MKLWKKLLMLCMTLALGCGVAGTAVACGGDKGGNEESSSVQESPETDEYVYRVTVQNETGFSFRGISVDLYDGETKIATAITNALGNANFTEDDVKTVGEYSVEIDMPAGYTYATDETYTTVALSHTDTFIQIAPTGVIKEAMPNNTRYDFGDVMYDFTLNLSDGTQFTLSEELEKKDVVLINFWATYCGPCKAEFPVMHNAATLYSEDVTVLALSTADGNTSVENFKKQNALHNFRMGMAPQNLVNAFSVAGIPHSIMVDKFGVVSFIHVGSMTSVDDFTSRFDMFNIEDYKSIILGTPTIDDGGGVGGGSNELIPPTEEVLNKKPTMAQVKTALSADNAFSFRFQAKGAQEGSANYDTYTWPWLVGTDGNYLYAPNSNIHNSYSTLYIDYTAQEGDVLCFDYLLGTEANADILYVMVDGNPIQQLSGYYVEDWQTCYAYVFQEGEAGEHEIALVFLKDSQSTNYDDVVHINNLRIENLDDIKDDENVDANVFRYAATGLNTDENAATQYKNYITPVYNEDDGYYHVDDKNGPILFANILRASQWSNNSVWLLAYDNQIVEYGINYADAIEYYAWEANNSMRMLGYTGVTEELRQLLEITVRVVSKDQKWNGKNHENEWLECCVYYAHYGATPQMEDPMRGITFNSAIELKEGANNVEVLFGMVPRGFKYKFIPTKSGVYNVYSTGTADSLAFLISKTRLDNATMTERLTGLPFLGEYNDKLFMNTIVDENGNEVIDYNFDFHYYFEEGETYYLLCATTDNNPATYNVNVDYVGETYQYMQYTSAGDLRANENTGAKYLHDAVDCYYSDPAQGGDGYYHESKTGSIIYLDVNRPTFFHSYSLYNVCRNAIDKDVPAVDRAFYVNGVDYTEAVMEYCMQAMFPEDPIFAEDGKTEKKGFIAVTKELMELLQIITSKSYGDVDKAWMTVCYYWESLSASDFS